jgi:hypothetical protein
MELVEAFISFPFSFQFFTRLAAVFAEEVGDFLMAITSRIISTPQRN